MAQQHPKAKAWFRLATDSFFAADSLRRGGFIKPAASRFYYASFQAAHAILLCTPAQAELPTRGNWDHGATLNGVVSMLRRYASVKPGAGGALRVRLARAYGLRIESDYAPDHAVSPRQVAESKAAAAALVRYAQRMVAS